MLFGWGSRRAMRRGLPQSELVFLEKFYEDYIRAMYGSPEEPDTPTDDANPGPDWDAEEFVVPASMPD